MCQARTVEASENVRAEQAVIIGGLGTVRFHRAWRPQGSAGRTSKFMKSVPALSRAPRSRMPRRTRDPPHRPSGSWGPEYPRAGSTCRKFASQGSRAARAGAVIARVTSSGPSRGQFTDNRTAGIYALLALGVLAAIGWPPAGTDVREEVRRPRKRKTMSAIVYARVSAIFPPRMTRV
jgi:hypothetical protein